MFWQPPRHYALRWATALLALALLTGCGGALAPTPTVPPPTAPPKPTTPATPPPNPAQPTPTPGGNAVTAPAIQAAITDLARRRSVDPSRITVANSEAVEWPNAGLGCPEPDRAYAAVITPGWRVRLVVDGQTVTYHTNSTGSVVTPCPRP